MESKPRQLEEGNDLAVVMRYSDSFAPPEGTIELHRSIIAQQGYAWFGKMGRGLGALTVRKLLTQIRQCGKAQLILVRRDGYGKGSTLTFHACDVIDMAVNLPVDERARVPLYYRSRAGTISTWFKIVSMREMSAEKVGSFVIASSGRPLSSALASTASFFLVARV